MAAALPGWTAGKSLSFFRRTGCCPGLRQSRISAWAQPAGAKRSVRELLSLAGLEAADGAKHPGQLSGGQRRRVAVLRGVGFLEDAADGILLLDEPFNGLDEAAAGRICQILRMLPPQTLTLLVSHQLAPIQGLNVSFFSMDDPA